MRRLPPTLGALLAAAVLAPHASASLPPRLERKIGDAVRTLEEMAGTPDSEIPEDLIADAACVAVLPDVAKGAVGIGGRYGKGLVSCRLENGTWGPPAFLELGGASIGLQLGGELVDLVLVVRNRTGADYLLRDRFTLGADASVAAGPVGRTTSASTDAALRAAILSWSRSRGAFIGVSLDGAVVKQDKSDNRRLYGRRIQAREILLPEGEPLPTPEAGRAFVGALSKVAPPKAGD